MAPPTQGQGRDRRANRPALRPGRRGHHRLRNEVLRERVCHRQGLRPGPALKTRGISASPRDTHGGVSGQRCRGGTYARDPRSKLEVLRRVTATRKAVFLAIVTTAGLRPNEYQAELVQNVVELQSGVRRVGEEGR